MKSVILAAAALVALTGAVQAQTVRFGVEAAYPPYNYMDEAGNVGGFDVDVGNEICKRAGMECEWVVNEWDTIITNLVAGNYDAVVSGMSVTEERKQTLDFSQEYFPNDPATYVARAGSGLDLDNPSGLRLATQSGTIQAQWLEDNAKANNTIVSYETLDQALADVSAGNVDALLADKSYLAETVAGSEGALELVGPDLVIGAGVAAAVRKGNAELLGKIDTALTEMKDDGTLDALITLYFPEREGGPFYATE
jgi:polar amino acid transport system substrate-binding protein